MFEERGIKSNAWIRNIKIVVVIVVVVVVVGATLAVAHIGRG